MGMRLTLTNVLTFFGAISPALLTFFLLMVSLFNQNAKGFVYIGGILVATVLNLLMSNMFQKTTPTGKILVIGGGIGGIQCALDQCHSKWAARKRKVCV